MRQYFHLHMSIDSLAEVFLWGKEKKKKKKQLTEILTCTKHSASALSELICWAFL